MKTNKIFWKIFLLFNYIIIYQKLNIYLYINKDIKYSNRKLQIQVGSLKKIAVD